MPVRPNDKPIAALREETIDRLIFNYSHGELSLEAFERRLDQALEAETHETLLSLTEDLDLDVDNTFREEKKREFSFQTDSRGAKDVDHIVNVFSGNKRNGAWRVPKELKIINIFGGTDLDFSEARFSSNTTHISVFSIFCGMNFFVPLGVKTTSEVICIFGGINNRTPYDNTIKGPELILEGLIIFGGISIKIKKNFRERIIRFADNVKSMFTTVR
jgi:hypothetical protein